MPPSEYAARQPSQEEGEKPVTVLVTGFGPFLQKFPINTSWSLASTLPALLPTSPTNKNPIHLYIHAHPLRVSYPSVSSLIPTLLPPNSPIRPNPDIILHIGLAAGRSYFAIESGSQRCGYGRIKDVDGCVFGDVDASEKFPTEIYPDRLETSFNTSDVLERWKKHFGNGNINSTDNITINSGQIQKEDKAAQADLRISHNPGNYLCGFIYYNSLAHYHSLNKPSTTTTTTTTTPPPQPPKEQAEKEGNGENQTNNKKPVIFLHVPDLTGDEEKMAEGREIVIALVKALVESMREVGFSGNGEANETDGVQMDNNFA